MPKCAKNDDDKGGGGDDNDDNNNNNTVTKYNTNSQQPQLLPPPLFPTPTAPTTTKNYTDNRPTIISTDNSRLMHGAIHANTPRYLADRVSAYVPSRSLRSADMSLLVVPRVNLERFGRRAFSCAGPSLWNSLPCVLRTQQDVERFRRDLKTYLFKQAFV